MNFDRFKFHFPKLQFKMVVLSQVTHASHLKNKNDISKSNLARDSSVVVFLVHSFDSKFNVGCWFPGGGEGRGLRLGLENHPN